MKKLLFVCYGLGIGGIEKCLVNLVNALPEEKFDVDILLMNPEYAMKNHIRRKVRYLDSFRYVMNTTDTFAEIKKRGGVIKNLGRFISYCLFRLRVKSGSGYVWKSFKSLPDEYDIAVAYSQNDYSPYYVIDKVSAGRKVMWYHNGAYEKTGAAYEGDKQYYEKFSYVVAVSDDCANVLNSKFEFNNNQLVVLRNICDVESILNKSEEFKPESYKGEAVHISTVGRLTKEKGCDIAIKTCKLLIDKGYNVIWHWVGDGNQKDNAYKLICDYNLNGAFVLEGNQDNPYPYIKCSDIYVQPSYYEAYSTTITEAKVLKKPIVTTDVGGMRDQLTDNYNGIITEVNPKDISDAVIRLIDDGQFRNDIIANLGESEIANNAALDQYYSTVFS